VDVAQRLAWKRHVLEHVGHGHDVEARALEVLDVAAAHVEPHAPQAIDHGPPTIQPDHLIAILVRGREQATAAHADVEPAARGQAAARGDLVDHARRDGALGRELPAIRGRVGELVGVAFREEDREPGVIEVALAEHVATSGAGQPREVRWQARIVEGVAAAIGVHDLLRLLRAAQRAGLISDPVRRCRGDHRFHDVT
jgi:hypothetical protein